MHVTREDVEEIFAEAARLATKAAWRAALDLGLRVEAMGPVAARVRRRRPPTPSPRPAPPALFARDRSYACSLCGGLVVERAGNPRAVHLGTSGCVAWRADNGSRGQGQKRKGPR